MTDAVFRTRISTYDTDRILLRGHPVQMLMTGRSFGEVVFLLLTGRLPTQGEARVFEAMLIASSDHGPNPPSTAAARVIASGNRAAVEAAIAGGVLAIGDVHGGAGERLMELMGEALGHDPDPRAAARRIVDEAAAAKMRIPGFGHRTHKTDPRAVVIFDLARRYDVAREGVACVEAIRDVLAERGKPLTINLDGALAGVLYDLKFLPALGKAVFIIGRVAGLAAHVLEEMERERPMRFEFPFEYDGP